MEEIVMKCWQLLSIFSVLCFILLGSIFVTVVVIAQDIQKQGTENAKQPDPEQSIRMALCVNSPRAKLGKTEWFTVGKVYIVKYDGIVDDQNYKWAAFAHEMKKEPHMNTCGEYEFYIV